MVLDARFQSDSPPSSPIEGARIRSTSSDGQSVWVHDEGLCVARFGTHSYEIHTAGEMPLPILIARHRGIQDWIAFRDAVAMHHGYAIPPRATPDRYWVELGITAAEPVSIPLDAIRRHFNPLEQRIWGRGATDRETIARMIAAGRTAETFVEEHLRDAVDPLWDACRIAHFVTHFEPEPMEIAVTSNLGHLEVVDGYHRLGAAIFRDDARFNVLIDGDDAGIAIQFPDQAPVVAKPLSV
jgi:hypothetical protein